MPERKPPGDATRNGPEPRSGAPVGAAGRGPWPKRSVAQPKPSSAAEPTPIPSFGRGPWPKRRTAVQPERGAAAEPTPVPSIGRGPWPNGRSAVQPERGAAAEPTPVPSIGPAPWPNGTSAAGSSIETPVDEPPATVDEPAATVDEPPGQSGASGGAAAAPARPRENRERGLAQRARAELYDALTGLPSPALMIDRTERMVARVARQPELVVGALFIEVDRLKDVNDELGEVAAGTLLKLVAERLAGVMRAGDTVGRLDGDEFVMLVESTVSDVPLDSLARRVIAALRAPVELEGFAPGAPMTVSVGAAVGPYASTDDLFRDARLALDSARAAGKDRFALFNASMRALIEGPGVLDVARP
jgi:diguanylate cyclase (GGDEF)-like protein